MYILDIRHYDIQIQIFKEDIQNRSKHVHVHSESYTVNFGNNESESNDYFLIGVLNLSCVNIFAKISDFEIPVLFRPRFCHQEAERPGNRKVRNYFSNALP